MTIREVATGKDFTISITRFVEADIKKVSKKRHFFDWKDVGEHAAIYKLCRDGNDDIKGLIALIDYPDEARVEVKLLAVSAENVLFKKDKGKKEKEYEKIAGNLLAFAARVALTKYGESACVSLIPKTLLKQHYMQEYGMQDAGLSVYLELDSLFELIRKFKV